MVILFFLSASAGDSLHTQMVQQVDAARAARDAVIAGDLDEARAKLKWIAAHPPQGLPKGYEGPVAALVQQADVASQATTLRGAAHGVAELARRCGSCHALAEAGPSFGVSAIPEGKSDANHMQRHQWAADRLWEGLVVPEKQNWTAGALMLLEEPLHRPGDQDVDAEVAALSLRVHRFGSKNLSALSDAERVLLYGDFLSTCAGCHAATGGGPKK